MGDKTSNKFKDYMKNTFIKYMLSIVAFIFIFTIGLIFFYYRKTIVKENKTYNQELSKLISEEYLNYREGISQLVSHDYIRESFLSSDRSKANQLLYSFTTGQNIKSKFLLVDRNGFVLTSNIYRKDRYVYDKDKLIEQLNEFYRKNLNVVFEDINNYNYSLIKSYPYIMAKDVRIDGEDRGYLIFFVHPDSMRQKINYRSIDRLVVTDHYDNVIFTTEDLLMNSMGKFPYEKKSNEIIEHGNIPYYYIKTKINNDKFNLITMTSVDRYKDFLLIGLGTALGMLVILFAIISLVSNRLAEDNIKAMDSLVEGIDQVKKGNLDYRIREKTFDEFQVLYDEFNSMNKKMKELVVRNDEIAERKRQMEIRQLESQFNPHFVYNIMEMLRYEILFDPLKASDLVVAFSNLMRYNTNYGNIEVELRTDMTYIDNYLSLQKMRFNERLNYSMDVDVKLLDLKIPKLILQPIVENSIKHGIENTRRLSIDITISQKGTDLLMEVKDNGQGMTESKLQALIVSLDKERGDCQHIGLYNSNRIIKLFYGPDYGLDIESSYKQGTRVLVTLPMEGRNV